MSGALNKHVADVGTENVQMKSTWTILKSFESPKLHKLVKLLEISGTASNIELLGVKVSWKPV